MAFDIFKLTKRDFMELFVEILFEIYGELMFLIIPEKNRSKKHIWISKLIAVVVLLAVISLAIWGSVLISDYNNMWGIVPIATAIVMSLIQIIAGIVLFKKNH